MNNDMDDLFRKAADDYSLNTDTSDWQKIAAALSEKENERAIVIPFYRKYWLLLIFFVIGSLPIFVYYLTTRGSANVNVKPKMNFARTIDSVSSQVTFQTGDEQQHSPVNSTSDGENTLRTNGKTDVKKQPLKNTRPEIKQIHSDRHYQINDIRKEDQDFKPLISRGKQTHTSGNLVGDGQNFSETSHNESGAIQPVKLPSSFMNQPDLVPGANSTLASALSVEAGASELLAFSRKYQLLQLPLPKVSVDAKLIPATTIAQQMQARTVKPKRFYLGIVGGADLTSVSLQKISNPGFHAGVMFGYQLSGRLSVESGFFLEKKNYFTDPEYFEKGRVYVSPNSTILSIDGTCMMYEIPVSIKYDLRNTYRSGWFVTAGLSSYIMRKENYSMLYRYNSSGNIVKHDYTYDRTGTKLLSQLRVTGGYSYKLPAGFSLRLEPYLSVPVTGVGYGRLNLLSGGINGGIFKRLF